MTRKKNQERYQAKTANRLRGLRPAHRTTGDRDKAREVEDRLRNMRYGHSR